MTRSPLALAGCALAMGTLLIGAGARRPAPPPTPGVHFVEVEGEQGEVKGAIYVPRTMTFDSPAPAIVFLHGYGECGTDGMHQLAVGLPQAVLWNPERWPFVVIAPQKPVFNADWDTYEDDVLAMLDLVVDRYHVDPERVAITGLSQGGHATIAIASRNPDRFRCAAPVCGYTEMRFDADGIRHNIATATADTPAVVDAAEGLKGMPVWLFHGGKDDVVSPEESRALHAALEAAGAGDVNITIFPGANHNAWDPTYRESGVWEWFAEHTAP